MPENETIPFLSKVEILEGELEGKNGVVMSTPSGDEHRYSVMVEDKYVKVEKSDIELVEQSDIQKQVEEAKRRKRETPIEVDIPAPEADIENWIKETGNSEWLDAWAHVELPYMMVIYREDDGFHIGLWDCNTEKIIQNSPPIKSHAAAFKKATTKILKEADKRLRKNVGTEEEGGGGGGSSSQSNAQ